MGAACSRTQSPLVVAPKGLSLIMTETNAALERVSQYQPGDQEEQKTAQRMGEDGLGSWQPSFSRLARKNESAEPGITQGHVSFLESPPLSF